MKEQNHKSVYDLSLEEWTAYFKEIGEPAFRAKQLWSWLYQERVSGWDAMTNLSKKCRQRLAHDFEFYSSSVKKTEGFSGETQKLLLELHDHEYIEAVLIPAEKRRTVCVSSQVGCKFGCSFCASGKHGFQRNLAVGEIIEEVLYACKIYGDKPSHIVFMGVGEPFDNYDQVLKAVRIINDHDGLDIGARRITISTCGVVPGIQALAKEGRQIELSVSLHATNDTLRSELMPVNQRYPVGMLMKACKQYAETTKRIITFEYTLIKGINDSEQDANALIQLLHNIPSRVNFLLLNPVEFYNGTTPTKKTAEMFIQRLSKHHINATLRESKGAGINAACGQLRSAMQD